MIIIVIFIHSGEKENVVLFEIVYTILMKDKGSFGFFNFSDSMAVK